MPVQSGREGAQQQHVLARHAPHTCRAANSCGVVRGRGPPRCSAVATCTECCQLHLLEPTSHPAAHHSSPWLSPQLQLTHLSLMYSLYTTVAAMREKG